MSRLRPNEQRAKNAIIFIWIVVVFKLITIISDFLQYNLLSDFMNGISISPERAEANDTRHIAIVVVTAIMLLVSGIIFIMWFRRAYFNLHSKTGHLSYKEGWAAGGWFIPIGSWFIPHRIMKEMYFETHALLYKSELVKEREANLSVVGWWWGLWVAGNVSGTILFQYSRNSSGTIDSFITQTIWEAFNALLIIVAAFFAVKVIKKYAKMEELMKSLTDGKSGPVIIGDDDILDSGF